MVLILFQCLYFRHFHQYFMWCDQAKWVWTCNENNSFEFYCMLQFESYTSTLNVRSQSLYYSRFSAVQNNEIQRKLNTIICYILKYILARFRIILRDHISVFFCRIISIYQYITDACFIRKNFVFAKMWISQMHAFIKHASIVLIACCLSSFKNTCVNI